MRSTADSLAPYQRWRTSYPSDGRDLTGFYLQPDGAGPHPAVVFNHGSIGLTDSAYAGIQALCSLGYAVFAPVRRGHNDEPGPYWLDQVPAPWGSPEMGTQLVAALRAELIDVLAAVEWVTAQPAVDADRVAVAGSSFGAVLTVLALGQPSRLRAGVSFAGPSMSWPDAPALQEELLAAAASGTVPMFLAQAFNDHSLEPTYAIGAALARHGRPHETRVYPAIGNLPITGHNIFGNGVDLWRTDVERFLTHWMTAAAP